MTETFDPQLTSNEVIRHPSPPGWPSDCNDAVIYLKERSRYTDVILTHPTPTSETYPNLLMLKLNGKPTVLQASRHIRPHRHNKNSGCRIISCPRSAPGLNPTRTPRSAPGLNPTRTPTIPRLGIRGPGTRRLLNSSSLELFSSLFC